MSLGCAENFRNNSMEALRLIKRCIFSCLKVGIFGYISLIEIQETIAEEKEQPSLPEPTGKKESKLYPEGYHSDDSNEKETTVLTRTNRKKEANYTQKALIPKISNGRTNGIPVVSFQVETHKKAFLGEKKKRHFEKDVFIFLFLSSDVQFMFRCLLSVFLPRLRRNDLIALRLTISLLPLKISEGSIVFRKKKGNNRPYLNQQERKKSKLYPEGYHSDDSNGRISEGSIVPGKEKGTTVLTKNQQEKKEVNYTQKAIIPKILMIRGFYCSRKEKETNCPDQNEQEKRKQTTPEGSYSEDF
ncbi:hypothetical protein CEXT_193081 [Caerostris extrusa]|uniref:Protein TIC 214 n=1 Tax=Caerostris extrusa TaxID=172846 RepID=A0AAV4RXF1_CAEEX|nr:hypothetical protein CEXT_193081 [Caerostris extrusa]